MYRIIKLKFLLNLKFIKVVSKRCLSKIEGYFPKLLLRDDFKITGFQYFSKLRSWFWINSYKKYWRHRSCRCWKNDYH
jgi:hypothetical protein